MEMIRLSIFIKCQSKNITDSSCYLSWKIAEKSTRNDIGNMTKRTNYLDSINSLNNIL